MRISRKSLQGCLVAIVLIISPASVILAGEKGAPLTTPPAGSWERKLILDALRSRIKGSHGLEVVFVVEHLKIKDGWAWVHTLPQDRDGSNRYEDVSALLRKHGAIWEVAELACTEVDNDQCLTNPEYFKLLKQRFPGMPTEILPFGGKPKTTPAYSGKNILQWYQTIPEKYLGGHRYAITGKDGAYVSRSTANYEINPQVDIEAGHLKVADSGTGGGEIVHELVFLETSSGNDIIAVKMYRHDGIGPTSSLRFYTLDGTWTDVTDRILPKVQLSDYLDEKHLADNRRAMDLDQEGIAFVYDLGSTGGPIFARIDLERFVYAQKSASKTRELVKQIKYDNVRFIWDKNKNALRFSGKGFFDGVKQKELLERIERRGIQ